MALSFQPTIPAWHPSTYFTRRFAHDLAFLLAQVFDAFGLFGCVASFDFGLLGL